MNDDVGHFEREPIVAVEDLPQHSDARGTLIELVTDGGRDAGGAFGLHLVIAIPGAVRGNHVHFRRTDVVCVIEGDFVARFQTVANGETEEYSVPAGTRSIFTIPAGVAHAFANVGDVDGYLLCYSDSPVDPADSQRCELFEPKRSDHPPSTRSHHG